MREIGKSNVFSTSAAELASGLWTLVTIYTPTYFWDDIHGSIGDEHPEAEVIGIDLSPIQPTL